LALRPDSPCFGRPANPGNLALCLSDGNEIGPLLPADSAGVVAAQQMIDDEAQHHGAANGSDQAAAIGAFCSSQT